MADPLEVARERLNRFRFSQEISFDSRSIERLPMASNRPVGRGLVASKALTPALFKVVESSCKNLSITDRSIISTIVYPAAEMQARCRLDSLGCVIEVTSSLVERLNGTELQFVIGHEIGHFLLDHHFAPLPPAQSIEHFKQSRAREISADRAGLAACGDVKAAMRAILKTFSGLSDGQLRYDTSSFINQAFADQNIVNVASREGDTHPTFAVRARCLVRFSHVLNHEDRSDFESVLRKVEERTVNDFLQYSEAFVDKRTTEIADDLALWMWMKRIVRSGSMSADDTAKFTNRFGAELSQKVQSQFNGMSLIEVEDFVQHRLSDIESVLEKRTPNELSAIVSSIENELVEYGLT